MMNKEYNILSNAELRIKMKEYENEYEVLKNKVIDILNKMSVLENKFSEVKSVLTKRTKGKI